MTKSSSIHLTLTESQRKRLRILAENTGFNTVSSYIRFLAFNPTFEVRFEQIIKLLNEIKDDLKSLYKDRGQSQ